LLLLRSEKRGEKLLGAGLVLSLPPTGLGRGGKREGQGGVLLLLATTQKEGKGLSSMKRTGRRGSGHVRSGNPSGEGEGEGECSADRCASTSDVREEGKKKKKSGAAWPPGGIVLMRREGGRVLGKGGGGKKKRLPTAFFPKKEEKKERSTRLEAAPARPKRKKGGRHGALGPKERNRAVRRCARGMGEI